VKKSDFFERICDGLAQSYSLLVYDSRSRGSITPHDVANPLSRIIDCLGIFGT